MGMFAASVVFLVFLPDIMLGGQLNALARNLGGTKGVKSGLQKVSSIPFGCGGVDGGDVKFNCQAPWLEAKFGAGIDCSESVPVNTILTFVSCPDNFKVAEDYKVITCKFPGKWDNDLWTCEELPPPETTTTTMQTTITTAKKITPKPTIKPTTKKPTTKKPFSATKLGNVTQSANMSATPSLLGSTANKSVVSSTPTATATATATPSPTLTPTLTPTPTTTSSSTTTTATATGTTAHPGSSTSAASSTTNTATPQAVSTTPSVGTPTQSTLTPTPVAPSTNGNSTNVTNTTTHSFTNATDSSTPTDTTATSAVTTTATTNASEPNTTAPTSATTSVTTTPTTMPRPATTNTTTTTVATTTAGYGVLSYGKMALKLYRNITSWNKAEAQCIADGGHLPTFSDRTKLDFLLKLHGNFPVLLGITDKAVEGNYTSFDGSPLPSFLNVTKRTPTGLLGTLDYDCVKYTTFPDSMFEPVVGLQDMPCDYEQSRTFVCEKLLQAVNTTTPKSN